METGCTYSAKTTRSSSSTSSSQEAIGLRGHPAAITGIGVSLDDTALAAATSTGTVFLWELSPTGPADLKNLPTGGFISAIEPSADSRSVTVVEASAETRVRRFDAATGDVLNESRPFANVGSFIAGVSASERPVAGGPTSASSAMIEDMVSSNAVLELEACERPFAVDDAGRWLLAVVEDNTCAPAGARVVDIETGRVLIDWERWIGMGDFGPSDTLAEGLVAVQLGPGLEVRRVDDGSLVATFESAYGWRPFFSADGRYITFGSLDSGGWALDVEQMLGGVSGDEAVALNKLIVGGPTTFTMAGAGYLITGHSGELLRFWHLDTGEEWLSLPVDTRASTMLALTADGRYLYYADRGGLVRRFPLDPDELADLARKRAQRSFTAEECTRFGITRCAELQGEASEG